MDFNSLYDDYLTFAADVLADIRNRAARSHYLLFDKVTAQVWIDFVLRADVSTGPYVYQQSSEQDSESDMD